jgi:RNA exonuclease 4
LDAEHDGYQDMEAVTMPVPHELCVALDCEMVGVGSQRSSVLARVSIVDFRGMPIFDTFVRVEEKVTDYRTFVSGVRPQDLESPHAMEYGECRRKVQRLLAGKILVGHALENDLKVLCLNHPWDQIRDTSVHPPFMKLDPTTGAYQARRLRDLSQSILGKVIQQNEHDSLEDARAALTCSLSRTGTTRSSFGVDKVGTALSPITIVNSIINIIIVVMTSMRYGVLKSRPRVTPSTRNRDTPSTGNRDFVDVLLQNTYL